MPEFTYTRGESSYTVKSIVDDDTYNAALAMFAESIALPTPSVEYAINYGIRQFLQDAAAQPASAAKAEGGDVPAAIKGAMDKRWDAFLKGTMSLRGGAGVTRDPFESACRRVMLAKLAAFIKTDKGAKVKATLKGASKETRALVYKKFTDANRAAIEAEAKRQLEAATTPVEFDLGDLTA